MYELRQWVIECHDEVQFILKILYTLPMCLFSANEKTKLSKFELQIGAELMLLLTTVLNMGFTQHICCRRWYPPKWIAVSHLFTSATVFTSGGNFKFQMTNCFGWVKMGVLVYFFVTAHWEPKPHKVSIDFTLPIDTLQGSMSPYHSRCHLAVNFHGKL